MAISFSNLGARLLNRGKIESARAYLALQRRRHGGPFWIDQGRMKLRIHGDGDMQEIYYYLHGREWWDNDFALISPYIKSGAVAIDVGANHGFITGILSTLAGPTGKVHSFEPSPVVYGKLLDVIAANNYTNVSPYNMGCGRDESEMTLYSPPSSGNATLRPGAQVEHSTRDRQKVRIVKLDDFMGPKLERLDFIKIDTEGFEDEVLAGALGLLQRFQPVLYIELCAEYLASSQKSIEFLRDAGYTFDRELVLGNNGENYFALPPGFKSQQS